MATTPTQIRIDADVKKPACILHEGLPFNVEIHQYSRRTREAMEEAKRISQDPNVKGYSHMVDLKNALDED